MAEDIVKIRHKQHINEKNKSYFDNYLKKYPEKFDFPSILEIISCKSREILCEKLNILEEHYIMDVYKCLAPNGYNLLSGGLNKVPSEKTKVCLSSAQKKRYENPEERRKISERIKGEGNPMFGKKQTEESKEKNRQSNIEYFKNNKNPNTDKIIVNNGKIQKFVSKNEPIPEGFKLGCTDEANKKKARPGELNGFFGKSYINNGIIETAINLKEESIPEGFVLGRLPMSETTKNKLKQANTKEKNPMYGKTGDQNPAFGKRFYTDGINQVFINPNIDPIPEGYYPGMKPHKRLHKNKIVRTEEFKNNLKQIVSERIKLYNKLKEKNPNLKWNYFQQHYDELKETI